MADTSVRDVASLAKLEKLEILNASQTSLSTLEGLPVARLRLLYLNGAQMLARVFGIDVLTCARLGCGGRLRRTAAVLQPRETALLLHGARGPPKPTLPGQLSVLNFDA